MSARDLLNVLSGSVELLFQRRGHLQGYLVLAEDTRGCREYFENLCDGAPDGVSDADALAVLKAELKAEFAFDKVTRFAIAFPACATIVLRETVLHATGQTTRQQVVCVESHDGDAHLVAHHAIIEDGRLGALSPVEASLGSFACLVTPQRKVPWPRSHHAQATRVLIRHGASSWP